MRSLTKAIREFRDRDEVREFRRAIAQHHPGFREAVKADTIVTAGFRGERSEFHSRTDLILQGIRLAVVSDAYLAMVFYRLKTTLQRRGIPILPRLAHRMMMALSQITIGDPVVIKPGVYIIHGQTVIDGLVTIGSGCAIAPWTSIGLQAGHFVGPTIGNQVSVGTGAKLLGEFTVGDGASIGANAVVTKDVAAGATVVGIPAKPVQPKAKA